MIPVAARHQVSGKLLHSLAIEAIGIVITGVVLAAAFGVPIFRLVILVVLAVLGALLIAVLNLMIDVLHPKLEWTNPQEAVKQNMNGLFGMMVSMLVIGILAAASVGMVVAGFTEWLVYLILAVIMGGLSVPALLGLFTLSEERYRDLEA
jgi:ABC-2 type transport system permease protein